MDRTIELLKEKNNYLRKFLDLNERELVNFAAANFNNLEYFYNTREQILDTIHCLDDLMQKENDRDDLPELTGLSILDYRSLVSRELALKDDIVNQILTQDLQILEIIEKEKSHIIVELKSTAKNKKALSGYKSGVRQSNLNEEA